MLFAKRQSPQDRLHDLYDTMAGRWQAGIDKLGYGAAYDGFFGDLSGLDHTVIADIGTGTGAFAAAYLKACETRPALCHLVDTSSEMLMRAQSELGRWGVPMQPACAALGGDRPGPGNCDAVLAAHVIEHADDPIAALGWCRTRLRPGGTLYLAVSRPHWCTALLRWKWGHRAYGPGEMLSMLAQAGFVAPRHVAFRAGPPSRTSAAYVATAP